VTLAAIEEPGLAAGQHATLLATATGGGSKKFYQFVGIMPDGALTVLQPYSESPYYRSALFAGGPSKVAVVAMDLAESYAVAVTDY
jgi:hypothetical protein